MENNSNSIKIGPYQAAALMLCFSLSGLAAFRPQGDSLAVCAAARTAAAAVGTVVFTLLPAGGGLRGRTGRRILAAVSGGYLLVQLVLLLSGMSAGLQFSYPDFYSLPAVTVCTAAAAAYCASMRLRGTARAACAAAVFMLVTLVLTAAGAADRFDADRLDLAVSGKGDAFIRQLLTAFSQMPELPLLAVLRSSIDRPRRAAAVWFAGHSLAWCAVLTVCAGVLGGQALTGIPSDTLSSYSRTAVIERFDALMLMMWALCSLLAAAGLLLGIRSCVRQWSEKAAACAVPLSAAAAAAAVMLLGTAADGFIPMTVLAAAMPAAALFGHAAGHDPETE